MGNVIIGATMSLDWFMNDRNGDVSRLYPDLEALRSTEMLQEEIRTTGAVVMGRRAYDMAEGDLTDYEYQVPIFVLTHHIPEKGTKGENDQLTLTFVTDGIESAIEKAKAAAGDEHVVGVRILLDHAEPQIGSRRGREDPRSFQLHLLIDVRLEKAKTFPKEDWDDANVDLVNQPGS